MKNASVLEKCILFKNIAPGELDNILGCLSVFEKQFEKGEPILNLNQEVRTLGILLSGGANIISGDFWGNRSIIAHVGPGEMFGEAVSCAGARMPFSVVAAEKTAVLFADTLKIMTVCRSACVFHSVLIKNMVEILAKKNLMLTKKLEQISRRSTREKLLAYLSAEAGLAGAASFLIPFNRQELADYLSVDRSALSKELSKLADEGVLQYEKNRFTLFKNKG